jgi:stage V sporulation protein B
MDNGREDAVTAGRGFLFIAFAKLYFLFTSTIVNLALPRLLGDPGLYGDFRVVNSFLSVITMVMITGTIQAVSKLVSENEKTAGIIRKLSLKIQSAAGVSISLAVFFLSDMIAASFFNDPSLSLYLKISSIVILFYAFYAVFIGLLNGLKHFHKQAACDVIFSTVKTGFILFLVIYGFSVAGAFWGFAFAAILILPVSIFLTSVPRSVKEAPPETDRFFLSPLLNYMIPIMLYTLIVNLLVQLDVLLLKSFSFDLIQETLEGDQGKIQILYLFNGLQFFNSSEILNSHFSAITSSLASESTSVLSGIFGAAKNIALIPYQIVIAVTFVAFPLVSKSTSEGDEQRAKSQVRNALRFALILSVFIMVSVLADPSNLLSILFGQEYGAAGFSLVLLLIGMVFFSLFSVANTLLTSAGHPRLSLLIGIISVIFNAVCIYFLIIASRPDESLLLMVSAGVLFSMAFSFVAGLLFVIRRFRTFLPVGTILRTVFAAVLVLSICSMIPVHGAKLIIIKFFASGVMFLVFMTILKEFTKDEFLILKKIFFRK